MTLLRSSAIVAAFTMLSRIFGFARDVIVANIMGAGVMSDAFFVAFKIPNFLRKLFAEGAFNAAFLPMFAGMLKVKGTDYAMQFASSIMTALTLILLVITLIAIYFMPELLHLIAPGFHATPEIRDLTIELSRITFPYLLFISLVSLLGGILNSHDRFAAVALTPIFLNLSLIGAALFLPAYTATNAHALAYGVLIAGIVQLLWLIIVSIRHHSMPRIRRPRMDEDVRGMLKAFLPVAFGAGIAQINQLIDMILASYLETAVSYLYYADRLYELPLGVIGIAIATALLPMLSRQIRSGEHENATRTIEDALKFSALIGLPATVALILIAEPIVRTIYEHGAFTANDSAAVIPALIAYSCGLPSFLLIKVFASCFFAATDTKTPVKIAVIAMFTNLTFNLILIDYYAHVGLAIATTISGWLNAGLLGYFLYKRHIFRPSRSLLRTLLRLCCALAGMAGALILGNHLMQEWLSGNDLFLQGMALTALVALGGGTYFTLIILCRAVTAQDMRQWLGK